MALECQITIQAIASFVHWYIAKSGLLAIQLSLHTGSNATQVTNFGAGNSRGNQLTGCVGNDNNIGSQIGINYG